MSLGCTKNLVDSEVMLGRLSELTLSDEVSEADVIIVNTCGFIHSAKQESIGEILRVAGEKKEGAILVVSGCLSERYAKELESDMPEIDIIIGVRDYDKIDSLLAKKGFFGAVPHLPNPPKLANPTKVSHTSHINSAKMPSPTNSINHAKSATPPITSSTQNPLSQSPQESTAKSHTSQNIASQIPTNPPSQNIGKNLASQDEVFLSDEHSKRVISNSAIHAYIKLSEGCNQSCSFCSIPSFKGRLRSRSIASVLAEVENLAQKGYKDFSFIAQDSSSYLLDFGVRDGLVALIKALDSSGVAKSSRIHYLYPTTTSYKLIEAIASSPSVQNYFDMPIQHIDDKMLKLMKRGAGEKKLREMLNLMRSLPNAFLRSTIIIGHPCEGEEEFDKLADFLGEGIFDRLNLFAFSSEEGTLAHTMSPKVPTKVVNARLNTLNKILKSQDKIRYRALKGVQIPVIVEGRASISEHFYSARDIRWGLEIDGEILINDSEVEDISVGYYEAKITEYKNGLLFGKILSKLKS
ncbi:MiaB/RimO family radical SAM methylthiotransferase [Helicobacter macacae]|nr:radical SAM protein [Helicobacter macacae]